MNNNEKGPLDGNQEGQKKVNKSNKLSITSLYQFVNIPNGEENPSEISQVGVVI